MSLCAQRRRCQPNSAYGIVGARRH